MARASKRVQPFTLVRGEGLSAGPCAAIYNRVSTDEQDPTLAMDDLRRAATQRGYVIALEVAETGSGKRNDRPGLQAVLTAARRGEVSAVLVARLDRFGRSTIDLETNIRALNDAGCDFVAVEQGLIVRPHGDAASQLLKTMLAAIAEFEHAIIQDRVRDGVRRARSRGVVFGRPRVEGPSHDDVRRMRAAGRSWSEIANEYQCTVAMARRRHNEKG